MTTWTDQLAADADAPDWIWDLALDAEMRTPEWVRQLNADSWLVPDWIARLDHDAPPPIPKPRGLVDVRRGDIWRATDTRRQRTFRIDAIGPMSILTETIGGRIDGRMYEIQRRRFRQAPAYRGYLLLERGGKPVARSAALIAA